MNDEVHVSQSNFASAKIKLGKAMENEREIQYAFCTLSLNQKINFLEESLCELEGDDIELVQFQIAEIKHQKELFQEILEILPTVETKEYKQLIEKDLGRLSYVERWKLYSYWRAETLDILAAEVNSLNVRVLQQKNELNDVETLETAEMVRQVDVVGITTTGAAKNKALLEHLKSKIGTVLLNLSNS